MINTDPGQNLLRYNLNNYKFLCYDYETESLCLVGNNKPWEVGYITVEGGKVTSEHNRNILFYHFVFSCTRYRNL